MKTEKEVNVRREMRINEVGRGMGCGMSLIFFRCMQMSLITPLQWFLSADSFVLRYNNRHFVTWV